MKYCLTTFEGNHSRKPSCKDEDFLQRWEKSTYSCTLTHSHIHFTSWKSRIRKTWKCSEGRMLVNTSAFSVWWRGGRMRVKALSNTNAQLWWAAGQQGYTLVNNRRGRKPGAGDDAYFCMMVMLTFLAPLDARACTHTHSPTPIWPFAPLSTSMCDCFINALQILCSNLHLLFQTSRLTHGLEADLLVCILCLLPWS